MPTDTFTNCRCPLCKKDLNDILIEARLCPHCQKPLIAHNVWLTRREPGHINLPGWVTAFGWPLLSILAAIGLFIEARLSNAPVPMGLICILLALGAVFFIAKLLTDGEEI